MNGPDGERVFTLQGADHRYRRIVEGMTEGAVIVSPGGMMLYANLAFANLVVTPIERVLGSRLTQYLPSAALGSFERLLRDAQAGTVTMESSLVQGGGRLVPVHVSAVADGEVEQGGICLITTDLTGAMHEVEQRFQFVADMLPQIIWSARPDGWVDYYNRRWSECTGLSIEQTSGWAWDRVAHPDDIQRCIETWSYAVGSGGPFDLTYRLRRRSDGATGGTSVARSPSAVATGRSSAGTGA